jgi:hypothetical protein
MLAARTRQRRSSEQDLNTLESSSRAYVTRSAIMQTVTLVMEMRDRNTFCELLHNLVWWIRKGMAGRGKWVIFASFALAVDRPGL